MASQVARRCCQTFFHRDQLWTVGRQGDERDGVRHDEGAAARPAGAVEDRHRVGAGSQVREISARWAFIAGVVTKGSTGPAAAPRVGQTAPKR